MAFTFSTLLKTNRPGRIALCSKATIAQRIFKNTSHIRSNDKCLKIQHPLLFSYYSHIRRKNKKKRKEKFSSPIPLKVKPMISYLRQAR